MSLGGGIRRKTYENTKGGGVQKRALGSHAAVAFWAFMSEKEPSYNYNIKVTGILLRIFLVMRQVDKSEIVVIT